MVLGLLYPVSVEIRTHFRKVRVILRSLIWLLFVTVFLLSSPSFARDLGKVEEVLHWLPESQSKLALEHYLRILGLSVYDEKKLVKEDNFGVISYFERELAKDILFRKKTLDFYLEINRIEKQVADYRVKSSPVHPHLGETLWTHNPRLPPGFVFQKALKISGRDPRLALKLIAVCGHDNLVSRHKGFSFCPTENSFFYYPQGLSDKADISQSLKFQIARIQAPTKGIQVLPAKAYHVYAAAFLTCELISQGMNSILAENMQMNAARYYRKFRISSEKEKQKKIYNVLLQIPKKDLKLTEGMSLRQLFQRVMKNKSQKTQKNQAQQLQKQTQAEQVYSNFYSLIPFRFHQFDESYAAEYESEVDKHFYKMLSYLSYENQLFCLQHEPKETCQRVQKTHQQWEIDETWTVAQHKAGAQFARAVCR